MRNNELNEIWIDIESHHDPRNRLLQRMVCVDLLFRAYVGSSDIPSKRFLSIEIPQTEVNKIETFSVPKGFTMTISEPRVRHSGYAACILQAAASDQNDIFTVLATDILVELHKQKEADQYVETLKQRIDKWRDFFKSISTKKLSDKAVIGLLGELSLIKKLYESGINYAVDLWNGPIKSSQDFQNDDVAIEVKTSATNSLEYVNISSEAQLDDSEHQSLFLVVYKVERNDVTGITLPLMIKQIESILPEKKKSYFWAKLTCLGYTRDNKAFYKNGYSIKESIIYKVSSGFPRLVRADLPQGVSDVKYKVSLQNCCDYESSIEKIITTLKESEYGESRGAD